MRGRSSGAGLAPTRFHIVVSDPLGGEPEAADVPPRRPVQAEVGHDPAHPGTGGDHQLPGLVPAGRRVDAHAGRAPLPPQDPRVGHDLGAKGARRSSVRPDRRLGAHVAEILQQGRLPTDLWYGFLNLGYKLLPAAGSDFPYMDLPGVVRSYVEIDGPFSVDAWFDAFRAGRLYVTNGPLLEVTANGRPLGDELHVEPGAPVEVVAEASLNPDLDRLDRLELVVHGEVVASEPANGRDRVSLRTTVTADRSLWLAVRAFSERQEPGNVTVAHSAPIYVIVEGRPFYRDESVPELVALQRTRLRELATLSREPP